MRGGTQRQRDESPLLLQGVARYNMACRLGSCLALRRRLVGPPGPWAFPGCLCASAMLGWSSSLGCGRRRISWPCGQALPGCMGGGISGLLVGVALPRAAESSWPWSPGVPRCCGLGMAGSARGAALRRRFVVVLFLGQYPAVCGRVVCLARRRVASSLPLSGSLPGCSVSAPRVVASPGRSIDRRFGYRSALPGICVGVSWSGGIRDVSRLRLSPPRMSAAVSACSIVISVI